MSRRPSAGTLNKKWMEDDSFVLATESDLKLAMELNRLPAEFKKPVREVIRAGTYMAMDMEKQRILDSCGGMQPDASQPGNILMAGVMREVAARLDRTAAKGRKSSERFRSSAITDLKEILKYIKGQFDFIAGLDDPERQMRRAAETEKCDMDETQQL